MTHHFIVIGNPIAHSQSPHIHQVFAKQTGLDICYRRQYCPNDEASFNAVVEAFFNGGGIGANVTVPFKQIAYQLCHQRMQAGLGSLSEHAHIAGAVNTLMMQDGKLFGDNTDGQGLVNHIYDLKWQLKGASVTIIGAGGATRGAILPLIQAGVTHLTIANRTVTKAQNLIDELKQADARICNLTIDVCAVKDLTGQFDLIINATSAALSGDTLPLGKSLTCQYAYDMMYGRPLPFLQHFLQQGAKTADGFGMLVGQAALSFTLWTGKQVEVVSALQALKNGVER